MMSLVGIYKIPSIKHVFFVISNLYGSVNSIEALLQSKKRRQYFEHIVQLKNHIDPKEIQQWTLKALPLDDFERSILKSIAIEKGCTNLSFQNPECLELLAINILKTPGYPSNLNTPKKIGFIEGESVIEVFI